jgi:protein SCO1/2
VGVLKFALWGAALVGAAVVVYIISQAFITPRAKGGLKDLTRGEMSRLVLPAEASAAPATSFLDADGKPVRIGDFRGKVVVLFFGFTQCPDVCPTTLATMAQVMQQLGPDADRIQVLFVTLDPKRDTPAVLSKYVTAFDPRFLSLSGDAEATARAAKEFKVFFQRSEGTSPDNYSIDHTAASYVLDPTGRLRLYVRHGQSPADVANDLKQLLAKS